MIMDLNLNSLDVSQLTVGLLHALSSTQNFANQLSSPLIVLIILIFSFLTMDTVSDFDKYLANKNFRRKEF